MSFSSQWLHLREPIDNAARNKDVLAKVLDYLSSFEKKTITDIGTGTGSTLRALTPHLTNNVHWSLIDNDKALLDLAALEAKGNSVSTCLIDLSKNLDNVFDETCTLVTTSAFLDLVSRGFLEGLVDKLSSQRLPFYAALTYDGRAGLLPPTPQNEWVLDVFNSHQKNDKGFGPALGPEAADYAIEVFAKAGYEIESGLSDWQAGPNHKDFQAMLLEGWCKACKEKRPDKAHEFEDWYINRKRIIEEAEIHGTSVFVGHVDFFAKPL